MIIEVVQAAISALLGLFGKKAVVNAAEVAVAEVPAAVAAVEKHEQSEKK